jgi:zinc and cadmium transporter
MIKDQILKRILLVLVGFSAGALMGGAFLHLLPEALGSSPEMIVFSYLIIGFVLFFVMERFLYWRHCHERKCNIHTFTYMNLTGDGIHNFVDGLVIAAGFVSSVELGLATTLAVIAHEIPQELGDFGVLLHGGFEKYKALFYNLLSALTAILGALVGFFLFPFVENLASFLVPFAAGGFIYIAGSDLIPELHKETDTRRALFSFIFFLFGIIFMAVIKLFLAE